MLAGAMANITNPEAMGSLSIAFMRMVLIGGTELSVTCQRV